MSELFFTLPSTKEQLNLYDFIDEGTDVVNMSDVDDEGVEFEGTKKLLRRVGVIKLIEALKIHIALSEITLTGSCYIMSGRIGNVITYSGVNEKNLSGIGKKFPIETLQNRVEARAIIRYLQLFRFGFMGEDEIIKSTTPKGNVGQAVADAIENQEYVCLTCGKKLTATKYLKMLSSDNKCSGCKEI